MPKICFAAGDWVTPTYKYNSLSRGAAYLVRKIARYPAYRHYPQDNRLEIMDDRGVIRLFNPANFKLYNQNLCREEPLEVAAENNIKAKSRYVIVNSNTGVVVRSSGEKDPHFNEWTNESIKDWLQGEVSALLRLSPSSKFDVYSYEMTGKLPDITVDWSSK